MKKSMARRNRELKMGDVLDFAVLDFEAVLCVAAGADLQSASWHCSPSLKGADVLACGIDAG